MTMITPSYLGETIEYSSLHACRSTLEDPTLRKLLRGQDPDQPVHDRDILFVPDSRARDLWNRTLEAAIQSVVGVGIYGGLVYSQWLLPKTPATSSGSNPVSPRSPPRPRPLAPAEDQSESGKP